MTPDPTLLSYLRDSEVKSLLKRRAFVSDLARLKAEVRNRGVLWRDLSIASGYQPDTLSSVFSDSMVVGQKRYNFKALITAMNEMGLKPSPIFDVG